MKNLPLLARPLLTFARGVRLGDTRNDVAISPPCGGGFFRLRKPLPLPLYLSPPNKQP